MYRVQGRGAVFGLAIKNDITQKIQRWNKRALILCKI
jgi:hypothetical protein